MESQILPSLLFLLEVYLQMKRKIQKTELYMPQIDKYEQKFSYFTSKYFIQSVYENTKQIHAITLDSRVPYSTTHVIYGYIVNNK